MSGGPNSFGIPRIAYPIGTASISFTSSPRLLGRYSAGAGPGQEIALSTDFSIAGGTLVLVNSPGGPFLPLAGGIMAGDILVGTNNAYDLGKTAARWKDGWFSGALGVTGAINGGSLLVGGVNISAIYAALAGAIFTGSVFINGATTDGFVTGAAARLTGFFAGTPSNQFLGTSADQTRSVFARFAANANGPTNSLVKSRGAAVGTNALVQNGDNLGFMEYWGADGVGYTRGAYVGARVDGAPGVGDMPTRLVFAVTPDGSAITAERWEVGNDGGLYATGLSSLGLGTFYASSVIRAGQFTFGTLPAAATVGAGARGTINDALAPAYLVALTGGGAAFSGALSNGAAWLSA